MTEEEARKKWCPFTTDDEVGYCVASKCMMWRVDYKWKDIYDEEHNYDKVIQSSNGGYCNLAGKP